MVGLHDEEAEEHRVVECGQPVRYKHPRLDVSEDDEHEPPEGDAGVHIAQQWLALPYLGMQQDIADDVP